METIGISNIPYSSDKTKNQIYLSGNFEKIGNHLFWFNHSLYENNKTIKEYYDEFNNSELDFLNHRNGDFLLIDLDFEKKVITVATDRLGKDYCFIYNCNNKFVLSNNFWLTTNILKPSHNDIDWIAVKRLIINNSMLFRRTYIKDLYIIEPASLYKFDMENGKLINKYKYWEIKYKEDKSLTISDAVEKLDSIFDNTFKTLSQKFNSQTLFGVGLSGGLDTRIIVNYALKNHLKIVPYCIGQKYLIKPFKTYGYYVAEWVAKFFNLNNFVFIDYNSEKFSEKLVREICLYPEKSSNIEIGCYNELPNFDIMLNGEHGGVFFGEFPWEPILNYNINNLSEYLIRFLAFYPSIEMIMDNDEIQNLKNEIQNYIDSFETEDLTEVVYKYFFEALGSGTKRGFFETNYYTKERYSPYLDSNFIDFYLTWNSKFRLNRFLQREFFVRKLRKLSKIPDEVSDAPLYWRTSNIKHLPVRIFFATLNKYWGKSLQINKWIQKDQTFINIYKSVINLNKDLIGEHFPNFKEDLFLQNNPRAASSFVKVIIVIDTILNTNANEKKISEFISNKYIQSLSIF